MHITTLTASEQNVCIWSIVSDWISHLTILFLSKLMHVFSYFMDTSGQLHAGQQCIKVCLCFRLLKNMQNLRGLVTCPMSWSQLGLPAIACLDAAVLFFTSRTTVQYVRAGSKAFQIHLNCWCMVNTDMSEYGQYVMCISYAMCARARCTAQVRQ